MMVVCDTHCGYSMCMDGLVVPKRVAASIAYTNCNIFGIATTTTTKKSNNQEPRNAEQYTCILLHGYAIL